VPFKKVLATASHSEQVKYEKYMCISVYKCYNLITFHVVMQSSIDDDHPYNISIFTKDYGKNFTTRQLLTIEHSYGNVCVVILIYGQGYESINNNNKC